MSRARDDLLDAARGTAVLGMVIDHLLLVSLAAGVPVPGGVEVRATLTRFVMPLFMVVSGTVLSRRGSNRRRVAAVAALGVVTTVAALAVRSVTGGAAGFDAPDILVVWSVVAVASRWWGPWALPAAVVGWVQARWVPVGWAGYEPGDVLLLMSVGALAGAAGAWEPVRDRLPSTLPRALLWVGQRPLVLYVGHLWPLMAVSAVVVR